MFAKQRKSARIIAKTTNVIRKSPGSQDIGTRTSHAENIRRTGTEGDPRSTTMLTESASQTMTMRKAELSNFKRKARTKAAIIYGLTTIIPLLVMVYIIQTHVVLREAMSLAWIGCLGLIAMAIGLLGGKLMKETWGKMGEALEAIDRLRKTSEPPPKVADHKAVNDIDRIPAVVNHLVDIARKQRVKLREHTEQLQALSGKIKEAKEQLQKVVREDWLTGLYNRRYFGELLAKEVERARRYGRQLALAMMEPDSIEDSSDSDGRQGRDETLLAIARAIQNSIRQIDIPSRYGSESFAILFPETSVEKACVALDRIKAAAEKHPLQSKASPGKGKLTVKVGVVMLCDSHRGPGDFAASAHEALYEAKSRGRNETVVYTPTRVILRAPGVA